MRSGLAECRDAFTELNAKGKTAGRFRDFHGERGNVRLSDWINPPIDEWPGAKRTPFIIGRSWRKSPSQVS
jgi:hypothetical protein